jgi:hypothetical protein
MEHSHESFLHLEYAPMKLFVSLPALALAIAISSTAVAENGAISTSQLSEMGLSGIAVMSDEAAMEIRGMGYMPSHKSLSLAFGISYATISTEDGDVVASQSGYGGDGSLGEGSAGTLDGFLAVGSYYAAGEHGSEAQVTKTHVVEEVIPFIGTYKKTTISSLNVAAGGKAKATSF